MSEPRDAASQVIAIAEHVEAALPRRAARPLLRRVSRALRRRARALLARREPLPARRLRPLRQDQGASPVGRVHALQALRSAVGASRRPRGRRAPCRAARSSARSSVQEEIYRALSNFVREGRPNRLVLLHGPNGSAKSHHRRLHHGARSSTTRRSTRARSTASTGSSRRRRRSAARSASRTTRRRGTRRRVVRAPDRRGDRRQAPRRGARPPALSHPGRRSGSGCSRPPTSGVGATEPPNDWIVRGQLSHKSQQVFEALLSSYRRLVHRGAQARAGRALLHLAALPRRAP